MRKTTLVAIALCGFTSLGVAKARYVVRERPSPPATQVAFSATSSAKGAEPWRAFDDDPDTAWCEGKAGLGKGEAITIEFPDVVDIRAIDLQTGFVKTEAAWKAHAKPTKLEIIGDDGVIHPVAVTGGYHVTTHAQNLELPPSKRLVIRFADVEKGSVQDACIAEIDVIPDSDSIEPLKMVWGVDADAMSSLPPTVQAFGKALTACDDAGFGQEVQYPVAWVDLGAQGKAVKTTKYKDAAGLARACKARQKANGGSYTADSFDLSGNVRGAGPGMVVVAASSTPSRWRLAWTEAGWRIVEIATYGGK